ncbi:hypothetical protein ABBQ32_008516 [Trebouxia sp. C0010 RCD-2024]
MLLASARTIARSFSPRVCNAASSTTCLRGMAQSSDSDIHSDFQPQIKATPSASVSEQIQQDIKDHKVFVYMKGNPEAPMCGFSNTVCRILDAYGVEYGSRNVLTDPDLREGVKKFSEWPTIPQVYIDGEFAGGCDILLGMHDSGDLKKMFLKEKA